MCTIVSVLDSRVANPSFSSPLHLSVIIVPALLALIQSMLNYSGPLRKSNQLELAKGLLLVEVFSYRTRSLRYADTFLTRADTSDTGDVLSVPQGVLWGFFDHTDGSSVSFAQTLHGKRKTTARMAVTEGFGRGTDPLRSPENRRANDASNFGLGPDLGVPNGLGDPYAGKPRAAEDDGVSFCAPAELVSNPLAARAEFSQGPAPPYGYPTDFRTQLQQGGYGYLQPPLDDPGRCLPALGDGG